jgi:hypothetical protein
MNLERLSKNAVSYSSASMTKNAESVARAETSKLIHAADQESRIEAGVLEDPRQHRCGGGLAVSTGGRQYPLSPQYVLVQPLRPGNEGEPAVEDFLHQRIAARDHVADHEQVGLEFDLRRIEALDQLDALRLQLRAHRRIDVGVAAGHLVAGLPGDHRDPAHERAADA